MDIITQAASALIAAGIADYDAKRSEIRADANDDKLNREAAHAMLENLTSLGVDDMPPPEAYIRLLLEMIAQRDGDASHDDVWQAIGVTAKRGGHLLDIGHKTFDWPVWFTLRELALRP